jgi:hypothetical protein
MKYRLNLRNEGRTNRDAVDETVNWLMNNNKSLQTKQGVRESDKHGIYNEDTTIVRLSSANLTYNSTGNEFAVRCLCRIAVRDSIHNFLD